MAGKGSVAEEGIVRWYEGRSVLVTGGAGFMGKVLLEKMLRALPGLRRIYLLLRAKRGCAPAKRLANITQLPIFDELRKERPEVLSKLVAVEGDILAEGLGLGAGECARLREEVSVVIHGAASLRMEADMKTALSHNTEGTRRVLRFCRDLPLLESFVHLSTAFCYPELKELDERVYPPHVPAQGVLNLATWIDGATLDLITPTLLGAHPNCYTFSKRLAEALVDEERQHMNVCIVRPSIVSPALHEPLPGWVDSLNGPVGLAVGGGKGVIRSMLGGRDFDAEVIPVDIAVNVIIAAAWDNAVHSPRDRERETPCYNASVGEVVRVTWGEVLDRGRALAVEYPFENVVWYPDGDIRASRLRHALIVFFFHTLPALFIDLLLLLMLRKPFMVRLQRRISAGLAVLQYFTMRPWRFGNARAVALDVRIPPDERFVFYIADTPYDVERYMLNALLGARQYCMKEPLSSIPRARLHLKIMFVLHVAAKAAFWALVAYLLVTHVAPARIAAEWATRGLQSTGLVRTLASD